ncbi:MAG: Rrf2 family transcriptional regulator [Candidatus Omnitrophica bacterium]|nr:Rrf2 family transcriptional regulator [Candidatus Omnitrophota bacterium]
MKLITRNVDYCIRSLVYMAACKKDIVCAEEMARHLNMPRPFLRKILQVLHKKGMLKAYKGKNGGFKLAVNPKKIFLLDLITAFHGPIKVVEHLFKKKCCPFTECCIVKKKMDKIEKYVISELKDITIYSLVGCKK